MKQTYFLWVLVLWLFSSSTWAFYCHGSLVDAGMYKRDVSIRCGNPESVDTHIEKRAVSTNAGLSQYGGNNSQFYPDSALNSGQQQYIEIDVVVEEWLYDFGRNRFQQLLRFENGRLVDIKELGYGH